MARTFRIRLICPRLDHEEWMTKENIDQTLAQVLNASWEFRCPKHGLQREKPLEAFEKRPIPRPKKK